MNINKINDEFILGLINIKIQKGSKISDKNTGTPFLDKGMFTFHFNNEIIILERHNLNTFGNKIDKFWFNLGEEKHIISEDTYNKAREYFDNVNYDKLKTELKKRLLNKKVKKIVK